MKLALLPGLDGTGLLFKPLLRALPPEIEPIVVTYPVDKPLGYDALLPIALTALPVDEPFVLLGESFGGPLALRVAALKPTGLRAVVLCASFVTGPYWFVPRMVAHIIPSAPFRLMPLISRIRSRIGGYDNSEVAQLSQQALRRVSPAVWARRVSELFAVDAREQLRSCHVPLLYLRGEKDFVVPARNLHRIQQLRPDIEVAYAPSPHLLLQSCPAEAAAALTAFIARHRLAAK
ncbi:alpha/beta fold hydrolase [Viridibacterium curvum]|uniref:AB hydrolase-1 domain-containing protein n=1 Tax=Viridibacterium curvum TaxID=1101404 RepID=A0ABP9QII6_9RHOO